MKTGTVILIVGGGALLIGGGYYLYTQSQKKSQPGRGSQGQQGSDNTGKIANAVDDGIKLLGGLFKGIGGSSGKSSGSGVDDTTNNDTGDTFGRQEQYQEGDF